MQTKISAASNQVAVSRLSPKYTWSLYTRVFLLQGHFRIESFLGERVALTAREIG